MLLIINFLVINGKKALHQEMVNISQNVQKEIKELLFAKE